MSSIFDVTFEIASGYRKWLGLNGAERFTPAIANAESGSRAWSRRIAASRARVSEIWRVTISRLPIVDGTCATIEYMCSPDSEYHSPTRCGTPSAAKRSRYVSALSAYSIVLWSSSGVTCVKLAMPCSKSRTMSSNGTGPCGRADESTECSPKHE